MSENTSIEWTHHTFNPWHGCTKVSAGCAHCYAKVRDDRYLLEPTSHWGPGAPRRVMSDAYWRKPYTWDRAAERAGRSTLVFCASRADVFEEEAPQDAQERLWGVIEATPHLRWQLLTKRPERILECIPEAWRSREPCNVGYGTSVEDANQTWRARELAKVPAVLRFLSVEPLLGPIPRLPLRGIGWVIVGGESGHGARVMSPAWARQIRDRVTARRIPFFFKQWGQYDDLGVRRRGKHYPGFDVLDGRRWVEYPAVQVRSAG